MIKVRLTPLALNHLKLISSLQDATTGFILGRDIGHFKVVEQVFPLHFNEHSIDAVYPQAYEQSRFKVLGVFFYRSEPFHNDWFLEDLIFKVNPNDRQPGITVFVYNVEKQLLEVSYE